VLSSQVLVASKKLKRIKNIISSESLLLLDCSFHLWIILQNELAILEFIHLLVETMDRHFGNVVSTAVITVLYFSLPAILYNCILFIPFPDFSFHISFLHLNLQCELDIMFHLEKVHFMLEEMVMNGCIVETNKANILTPVQLVDRSF